VISAALKTLVETRLGICN